MSFLILQALLCAMLAWSSFCRLVRTDQTTIREVRFAFWFQLVAAMLVLGAPFLPFMVPECDWKPWTTPTWVWLTLLLSAVVVQLTTARHWRNGVPSVFIRQ